MNNELTYNIISVDKKHCIVVLDKWFDVVILAVTAPSL